MFSFASSDPELSSDYWYEDSYGYNIASENRGSGGGGGSSGSSIPDRPVPIWLCVFLGKNQLNIILSRFLTLFDLFYY